VKTKSGKPISRIGIGSYGIGGRGHRDMDITEKDEDQKYVGALVYTLQKGANFTEIALGYGHGQSLALFKQALDKSTVDRQDIFLTHSLYPRDLPTIEVVNEDIASFYRVMETAYADSTLITQSLIIKFGKEAVYPLLHKLLETGKTRYVSLSNASPNWIRAFKKEFDDKFIAHEGHLSFEVRALQDKGVFQTCDELGVKNIIWRPLRRNKTLQHNWELLTELAKKYQKTQSQIVLNWICQLGYNPMVFSTSQEHIDENISATDFQMSAEDYQRMTDFRPQNYQPIKVDWEGMSIDDDIVALANNFEEHIQK
jgi:diketogulonate reductase-like aldo/keto reductase